MLSQYSSPKIPLKMPILRAENGSTYCVFREIFTWKAWFSRGATTSTKREKSADEYKAAAASHTAASSRGFSRAESEKPSSEAFKLSPGRRVQWILKLRGLLGLTILCYSGVELRQSRATSKEREEKTEQRTTVVQPRTINHHYNSERTKLSLICRTTKGFLSSLLMKLPCLTQTSLDSRKLY